MNGWDAWQRLKVSVGVIRVVRTKVGGSFKCPNVSYFDTTQTHRERQHLFLCANLTFENFLCD